MRALAISAALLGVMIPLVALAQPSTPKASPVQTAKSKAKQRTYKTCPSDKVWSDAQNGCVCATGTSWDGATRKCVDASGAIVHPTPESTIMDPPDDEDAKTAPGPTASTPSASKTETATQPAACGAGKRWSDAHGRCIVSCPNGKVADAKGVVCVRDPRACPPGKQWNEESLQCVARTAKTTAAKANGSDASGEANAKSGATDKCPAGRVFDEERNACVVAPKSCPNGREWKDAFDACVPMCPAGQVLDFHGIACHPIRVERRVIR